MICNQGCTATRCGARFANAIAILACALACAGPPRPPDAAVLHTAEAPSDAERYCAWFGDARDGVLYMGVSPFWSATRETGDPTADLRHPGPRPVGRFDLAEERWLEPLEVGLPEGRAGLWDVLAHPNGRVYFTSYFEEAGWVDPETGRVTRWTHLGPGLNELALGPDGSIWISRYPTLGEPERGGVLRIDPEGRLLAEHPIPAPDGYRAGPKTVAVDPLRGELWVAMDWLPADAGSRLPIRHDAVVLDADGALLLQIREPELQFVAFAADGTGYRAERDARGLALRVVPPDTPPAVDAGTRIDLDPDFPAALDFAQEVRPVPGGGAIVTRWSGHVHHVDASGRLRSLRLPEFEPGGLYYTAVLHDGRVCVSYCADVQVVCADAP